MTVLIVEDDAIILEGLKFALTGEGYQVLTASSVSEAQRVMQKERKIDFYLLDLMLPDGDGCELCRKIRRVSAAPVLFLTACDDEVSTVWALELGADDYIAKPFRIRELIARMKAIGRRTAAGRTAVLEEVVCVGRMRVNLHTGRMYREDEEVALTALEYRLLLVFLNHRGQTLTRRQILDGIWDEAGDFVNDNTLSVYIKRLRRKIGDTPEGAVIQTVRGIGYRMEKEQKGWMEE